MTDPFLDSVATALAGQVATALGTAGSKALEKVRGLIRAKSEKAPEAGAALEAVEQPSAGDAEIRALAERLDQLGREDPEFAEQLRTDGEPVHREISTGADGVVNVHNGSADKIIQARDIQGGITLN